MYSSCNLLIGNGHVLRGWSEHALHQGALSLQVVVHWGGDCKVSKAAEVCVGTVQQVVQTLAALQACTRSVRPTSVRPTVFSQKQMMGVEQSFETGIRFWIQGRGEHWTIFQSTESCSLASWQ